MDILPFLAFMAPWLIYRFFAYNSAPEKIEVNQEILTIRYKDKEKKTIDLTKVRQILFRRSFLIIIPNFSGKNLNIGFDGYSSDDIASLKQTLSTNTILAGRVAGI
jgi:hypothetical protein